MIVGCGRVRGFFYFFKIIDKGKNWILIKLNDQVGVLIVLYFFDEKNGIMIGGIIQGKENFKVLILLIKDGGEIWNKVFEFF